MPQKSVVKQMISDGSSDLIARQILADMAGMTVNNSINELTTRIIFGSERDFRNSDSNQEED